MKTFIFLCLLVMLLPVTAFCVAGTEVETWYWDGTTWVGPNVGQLDALARCWAAEPAQGACNKQDWSIPVTIHASVAQWIEWSMSGTRWDWKIRKPGKYGADCITAWIKSNQAVQIDYHDFADLYSPTSINPYIPIWYHVSNLGASLPPVGSPLWTRAVDMNLPAEWDTLPDSQLLHDGIQFKLWNMIEVVNCNSACEYEDQATISLKLLVMKDWIDPLTGYFKP